MRTILLAALLAGCCQAEEPIVVFGDSISASHTSWANQLRDDGMPVRLLAQAGRAIIDYDIPRDIYANWDYSKAVYFLGANDIGRETPIGLMETLLRSHLNLLRQRGFTVYMVLPPVFYGREDASKAVRQTMKKFCGPVVCIDLQEIWGAVETLDTVHPTEAGQALIAEFIGGRL